MCLGSRPQTMRRKTTPSTKISSYNINISFWNINGYKSQIFGNKLADPDFLSEIKKSDIIGISETHIHDEIIKELAIPGFVLLDYKNRNKNSQNSSSRGLAIFVKHEIKKYLTLLKQGTNT